MNAEKRSVILHIDDDESNRYAVRRILEKSGFEVIDSPNGAQGIEDAEKFLPDLIVLDIRLPDIDGFEVCRRIKANKNLKYIPVLQTSASFVSSEHKVEGLDSGADGYLAQPIEAAVLVATVRSLLRIRHAEKAAYEAMRSREEVLAIVSHDLRNPLSFIMMQTKLMEAQYKSGKITPDDIILKMKKINNSCQKMNRLISDILDVSSIDQGKFKLEKIKIDVGQMLAEVISFFEDVAFQSEISVLVDESFSNFEITADKDRLQQLLANLVSNSLKYTPSGGRITLSAIKDQHEAIFSVEDSGSGISQSDLINVFNRYWQAHPERKNGYGIGLSIVKGITEAHGGKVRIESEENKGTKVYVTIPL